MIHKTTRSILSVLLAVLLLVTGIPLTPAFADGGAVSPQSASGEGRALKQVDGVYQIGSAAELQEFAKLVNDGETTAWAELTANIDLSEICGENIGGESVSWTPIGTSINNPYEGNFNGAGHTISGLYINRSDSDQGLFGYVSGSGKIEKLSVSGTVSGHLYVGGIAGQNNGNVINCTFSGSVTGIDHVGGVVGYNHGGRVENCYNTGAVNSSGNRVGGVVGDNYIGGSVTNCYNTGSVKGSGNRVGGVVGYSSGSVKNCYNTGKVSGNNYVGGVVGYNISGSVTGCYFLQQGELPGIGDGSGTAGATGLTADQFKNQTSFTKWDFGIADTWTIHSVLGRPVLNENWEGGLGTEASPYEISTATQLENFRDLVNGKDGNPAAWAVLMNNIDLNGNATKQWTPIGTSESTAYTGTFNGQNFKISALYIDSSGVDYKGLFGCLGTSSDNKGTVQNLTVSGTVSGNYYVGGVVGYNNGGTVTGCIFSGSGSVSGKNYVGGVVGYNYSGIVTGCIFSGSGSVSGEWYVGGIAGRNNGTVKNCYNTGQVNGSADSNDVGGVVGLNHGTVENCYNTVSVSGKNYVGGVVGYNNGGSVTNSYNTGAGTVTGTGDYVGGVVGYNRGIVENCYNTGTVSGLDSVGGVAGLNHGSVKNCYNTGSVSGGAGVGGVVGYNDGDSVTNCYFLKTADVNKNLSGIGFGGEGEEAIQKTADAFHSGEVAYLLQNGQKAAGAGEPIPLVWGQSKLGETTSLPTLNPTDEQKVYQVTFDYGDLFTDIDERFAYSYTNGVVSEPDKNPALAGHTLSGWYSDESLTTEWNFATEISNDTTLYAKWTENAPDPDPEPTPDPEPEEPPYTGKYSYELSTSVGDHGTLAVDRYATEGEKVTITVTPDEAYLLDDLSVTAGGKEVALTANSDGTYTFTMPSADVRITATFAEDPDWTPDEPEEPSTDVSDLFSDIAPDAWYKDAIQYAYDNGLMTGVSATEFAPEQTTTRAMIVSILARLEGVTTAQAAGFADVDDNDWYATAVNWAASVGVVNGYEDNTFKPNTAITREQLAAILMNYAAYKGEDVSNRADLTSYTDQPSTWAQEAMQWAVAEGLISGVTADTLQPQGAATRAQVAAILQRFLSE